jgi:cytochrome c
MKKTFIVLGISLLLAACGSGKSDNSSSSDSTASAATGSTGTAGSSASTSSSAGAQLIANSDCGTCHKEQEKLVGPAFIDVAKKYTSADVDSLANKIINGGSGHWGTTPMSPHPGLSVDDAKSMVNYILSLKK